MREHSFRRYIRWNNRCLTKGGYHMTGPFLSATLVVLWLSSSPFALLSPAALTPADHRALARGEVGSRTIDGLSGQVGIFAVSRIDVTADALVASARIAR
jgi:hypothetical protein